MIRRPPRSTRTDTLFPYTTLFRSLRLETVPGSVNARPRDYEYLFPLQANEPRVQQAWGGRHSHADAENRHAVDFAADPGTVVFAARDGVVMRIRMEIGRASGRERVCPYV